MAQSKERLIRIVISHAKNSHSIEEVIDRVNRLSNISMNLHEIESLLCDSNIDIKQFIKQQGVKQSSVTKNEPNVNQTFGSKNTSINELINMAKKCKDKGGLTIEAAADKLDCSPRRITNLLEQAKKEGFHLDFVHNEIVYKPSESSHNSVIPIKDVDAGEFQQIGVISDLHFGSIYCMAEEMKKFVIEAYNEGVRDFFSPGDILEGCYRHARWELSHVSWEGQATAFLDAWPNLPGTRLFWIDGNHDWEWTDKNGTESGRLISMLAKERGINGLEFHTSSMGFRGSRGKMFDYNGTKIELHHPKKGAAYALSYQNQKKLADTAVDKLPDILLVGHVHQYVKFRRQNAWAFYCGTFQHGDSPYGRSIGGDVALGGLIIKWRKDGDGKIRRLSDEFRSFDYSSDISVIEK